MSGRQEDLGRIDDALERASSIVSAFTPGRVAHRRKDGGDPVTDADTAINDALLAALPRDGEGWLSEETADDSTRLERERVWVVDPIDGTREFVDGVPEWCVSVGLVERGRAVAGGILVPARELRIVGSIEDGVRVNGKAARARPLESLDGVEVLASRSEVGRGEWERFASASFRVRPMGSVALKMGLVAAGLADATWTLVPKNEWDVAAGAALVAASGGEVCGLDGSPLVFNRARPRLTGLVAAPRGLMGPIRSLLAL